MQLRALFLLPSSIGAEDRMGTRLMARRNWMGKDSFVQPPTLCLASAAVSGEGWWV
jgi:hypothetical protein